MSETRFLTCLECFSKAAGVGRAHVRPYRANEGLSRGPGDIGSFVRNHSGSTKAPGSRGLPCPRDEGQSGGGWPYSPGGGPITAHPGGREALIIALFEIGISYSFRFLFLISVRGSTFTAVFTK